MIHDHRVKEDTGSAALIPDQEWRRDLTRLADSVRYPSWYPWYLRGVEGRAKAART